MSLLLTLTSAGMSPQLFHGWQGYKPQSSCLCRKRFSLETVSPAKKHNFYSSSSLHICHNYFRSHSSSPSYLIPPLKFRTAEKLSLWRRNNIILWLGVIKTWGTVLKGCSIRKTKNYCSIAMLYWWMLLVLLFSCCYSFAPHRKL